MIDGNRSSSGRRILQSGLATVVVASAVGLGASAATAATQNPITQHPATQSPERRHPGPAYHRSDLERDMDAILATGVTGVLGHVDLGRREFEAGAGVADTTTGRPVDEDGYFRMGSNTKTFVAVVVLQLVDEGRLSLDDTLDEVLPGVVEGNGYRPESITVRNLLQQTSGIHDYLPILRSEINSPESYLAHRFDTYAPEDLVAVALAAPPDFPPGEAWGYSNTNYILAGMLIERVTGRTWAEEVRSRILRPLGMRHTFDPGTWPGMPSPHARGYHQFAPDSAPVDTTVMNYTIAGAAGTLVTTADDLTRFWQALENGRLLGEAGMAAMHDRIPTAPGSGLHYGLGLMYLELGCGGGYWAHFGDVAGYATFNGVSEDGERTVVLSLSSRLVERDGAVAASTLVANVMCA